MYRYNYSGGSPVLDRDLSIINDSQVIGCDSRDGFKQMGLVGEIERPYLSFTSSTIDPNTTLPQCSLLDISNNP